MESQKRYPRIFSCEFFPPYTSEGMEKWRRTRLELEKLKPAFFSVTFGAGGTTRDRTVEIVQEIHRESAVEATPHLTCVGSTRDNIRALLDCYRNQGIRHIVALRGDLPSGMRDPGEFRHANELVGFIRAETGDHFHIEVAAYPEFHPQATSVEQDLLHFQHKVAVGANSAITQYFYNAEAYFRFIDSCDRLGISIPIVPGIMPITNFKQLARFSDNCGAEIPRWIRKRLEGFGDDRESLRAFGLDVVTAMCHRLLEQGAPGLHFYTMNQFRMTRTLWERLGLPGAD
ncbi:MAG: methylenetetrahydrofolate reductase [NAD(P)H] [Candidatus Competibacteraceae bacterium]